MGSGNSLSWSHTCTGSNLALVVGVLMSNGNSANTSVAITYNGVSMTKIDSADGAAVHGWGNQMFLLIGPSTGSNTIAVTFNNGGSIVTGVAASYTGCAQTGQPDSHSHVSNDTTGTLTLATTVVASGCWLVGTSNQVQSVSGQTAGTGTTVRQNLTIGLSQNASMALSDSNGTVATGGRSLILTATTADFCGTILSLVPVASTLFTRANSDSFMNAASRSSTVSRSFIGTRTASDSFMNSASRLATVAKGYVRTASDSFMNAASRLSTVTKRLAFARTSSDSMFNAASRTISIGRILALSRAISDSFSNAATRLITVAIQRTIIRSASDSFMTAAGRFMNIIKAYVNGIPVGWKLQSKNTTAFTAYAKNKGNFKYEQKS